MVVQGQKYVVGLFKITLLIIYKIVIIKPLSFLGHLFVNLIK